MPPPAGAAGAAPAPTPALAALVALAALAALAAAALPRPVALLVPSTGLVVGWPRRRMGGATNLQMVGEVARGLSLFGGASSEVRRCNCSSVVV